MEAFSFHHLGAWLENPHPLFHLGVLLLCGYAGGKVANYLRAPRVSGYSVTGMLLSPSILGVFNEQVVSLEVPQVVELVVTETAPALKNATATAQTKEAILETGISVQVPGYLESGEKIKVDTRECRFISRA